VFCVKRLLRVPLKSARRKEKGEPVKVRLKKTSAIKEEETQNG
jgi:hypothetical protein